MFASEVARFITMPNNDSEEESEVSIDDVHRKLGSWYVYIYMVNIQF